MEDLSRLVMRDVGRVGVDDVENAEVEGEVRAGGVMTVVLMVVEGERGTWT